MFCAPDREQNKQQPSSSCLDAAELRSLAAHYNQSVGLNPIPPKSFESVESLITDIGDRMRLACGDKGDHCWIEQPFIRTSAMYMQLQKNFLPLKPSSWKANSREWLNTYDILNAMKPYERKYKDFMFMGAFPSDFSKTYKTKGSRESQGSCIIQNMCHFDIGKFIASGKKRFGIVINLDKHNQPGSHWVACSCSLDAASPQYGIGYFDSGGNKPPRDVMDFIKEVKSQIEKGDTNTKAPLFKFNHIRKQFKNTECGVFAMLFIKMCLQYPEKTYKEVKSMITSDKQDNQIHKFRSKFFRD
jgi:hypothetical protein